MKSTFSQFVNAKETASLESQTDSVEVIPAPVDALELVDDMRRLREVEADIQAQQEKVIALEALVTSLAEHSGPMSVTELHVMHTLVKRSGASVPSTMGMGMEAYTGNRHGMMRRVALESFTDQLKKAVDWLIELLVKLGEFLMKVLDGQEAHTRELLQFLRSYQPGVKRGPTNHHAQSSAVRALSISGRFQPGVVLQNVHTVVKSVADHSFQAAVAGYQGAVLAAIQPFGQDGENWRSHVDGVNKLSPPVPHGFTVQSQDVEVAHYTSMPLYHGDRVVFATVAGNNNHGARGAKARAQALTKIGRVMVAGTPGHQANDGAGMAIREFNDAAKAAIVPQAISLLEDVTLMVRGASTTASQMKANAGQMKTAAAVGETHAVPEVQAIVSQLIISVGQVAKMNGKLASTVGRMANNAVNMIVHLLT